VAIVENALPGATMLALGGRHSCAVVGGAVKCWGANDKGQLGTGDFAAAASPVASLAKTGVTSLSAAGDDTCAVATGQAKCWGLDVDGQTGSNDTVTPRAPKASPQPIGLSGSALQVTVGRKHACATSDAGGTPLSCWGSGGNGQIGNGSLVTPVLTPQQALVIDNGQKAAIFVTGEAFTCSAKVGEVSMNCNGLNDQAQCGVAASLSPVLDRSGPSFGGAVVAASAGRAFACALVDLAGPRVVMCWGANAEGQLGRATPASAPSFTPDLVGK
jgi:alpha-tubulin suppressor-like RCC1 family protein